MNRLIKMQQPEPGRFFISVPFLGGVVYHGFQASGPGNAAARLLEILAKEGLNVAQSEIVFQDGGECELDLTFLCTVGELFFYTQWCPDDCLYEVKAAGLNFIGRADSKTYAVRLAQAWARHYV
jgi:hypothetical protein